MREIARTSWAGRCKTSVTVPTSTPAGVSARKPNQVVVVVLVGLSRSVRLIDVDHEHRAAQRLGGRAVIGAGEPHEQPARMPARTHDGQRTALGRIGGNDVADREPPVRVVGANLDADLALDAVRPADASDDELHR